MENDASWSTVDRKPKKKGQSQVQNKRGNPAGTNTGAPGVSSLLPQVASSPHPTNPIHGSSSASQPRPQDVSSLRPRVASSPHPTNGIHGSSSAPGSSSASQPRPQGVSSSRPPAASSPHPTSRIYDSRSGPGSSSASQPRSQSNWSNQSSSQGRSQYNNPSRSAPRGSTSSITGNNTVDLYCNHFEVQFRNRPLPTIYQYRVAIYPKRAGTQNTSLREVQGKGLKRRIFNALSEENPELKKCAYDGASELYSTRLLTDILNGPNEVLIPRTVNPGWRQQNSAESSRQPEARVYEVTIQPSQSDPIEGSSFPSRNTDHGEPGPTAKIFLQALTIFLLDSSEGEGRERRLRVGSNYYKRPSDFNVDYNVVVWEGFHSSFRLTYAAPGDPVPRLVLNHSDVMTTVLVSQDVLEFIRHLLGRSWIDLITTDREARNMVSTALSGVRVEMTCGKYWRQFTIQELTSESSITSSFRVQKIKENGETVQVMVNVEDYFFSQHGYRIQRPHLPLLCMKGGNNNARVLIPIEVCTILDAQRYMRLSPDQRSKVLTFGKISPGAKKENIENNLTTMAATYEALNKPLGESFGIHIQRRMMHVQGQVLAAPVLYFGDNRTILTGSIRNGKWNVTERKMANPIKLGDREWAVYLFRNDGQSRNSSQSEMYGRQANRLAGSLKERFTIMGMENNNNGHPQFLVEDVNVADRNPDERIQSMLDTLGNQLNLIVAVLPSKSAKLYVPLKKICETTADRTRTVITQCLILGRKESLDPNHLANVAIKVNLKMGGSNSTVKLESILGEIPTCIFGIDVSHGPTKDTDKPSIAAVVASVEDKAWSRYAPQVRKQVANQERVEDLQVMVKDLLEEFRRNRGQYPRQIIVYRDGVSESQFETVGQGELGDFRTVCEDLEIPPIPITFIIVQKRHHTRFFKRNKDETFENMAPGTVITSQVCQTQNKDFYLCSHQSFIQDSNWRPLVTSRPAHYTILRDEINLGQVNIQNLTNQLCYCFGRATTAVSIPAPVYYAHVAAKHYSYFVDRDEAGGQPGPININDKLKESAYRMFYI